MVDKEDNAIPEAVARKQRSILQLRSEGVPILESLPRIETVADSKRHSTEEVATRAMALCVVAVKGEGLEQAEVERVVECFQLAGSFTAKERTFIEASAPSQHDRVQCAWQYECYWVMLWALGFIKELDWPGHICDVKWAVDTLRDLGRDAFVAKARLRPQEELLDATDLIYRYHWACRNAQMNGGEMPAGLDGEVVMERHRALNWLVGYMDQEWDDISTDT
jgi:hypothetical protein